MPRAWRCGPITSEYGGGGSSSITLFEVSDASSFPKSLDVLGPEVGPENDVRNRLSSPGFRGASLVGVAG